MPIDRYFKGHGTEVLADMRTRYGEKKGTSVFYATANKRHENPGESGTSRPSMAALKRLRAHG